MKRLACILCLFLVAVSSAAQAQERPAGPPPPPSAKPAATQPAVKIAGLGRRELTWRERVKLGLTTVNAVAAAIELSRDGLITSETDQSITCARILARIAIDHPAIDSEEPEFIDRLIEFLEGDFRFILNALKKQGT